MSAKTIPTTIRVEMKRKHNLGDYNGVDFAVEISGAIAEGATVEEAAFELFTEAANAIKAASEPYAKYIRLTPNPTFQGRKVES